ncbi:MAG: hypothetical protein Q4F44_04050, partial [Bacteroidales bacterium]|nr:hypothetical protein [Bacteroidales bacterium]
TKSIFHSGGGPGSEPTDIWCALHQLCQLFVKDSVKVISFIFIKSFVGKLLLSSQKLTEKHNGSHAGKAGFIKLNYHET